MAKRADLSFVAADGGNGTFWIRADQISAEGGLAMSALLGFELAPNTTRQEALEIADYMNRHIKAVYYSDQ
jgi:hypothetical protein